jgi:predicted DNA-binding transcriptional regulator AlpA
MPFITYRYLESEGIMPNRMTLARSIEQLNFPRPIALGQKRLAWDLSEVTKWIESRPRRSPKTGPKPPHKLEAASVPHIAEAAAIDA